MATAVITGASTGIGRDLALLCAKADYDLAIVARNEEQLKSLSADAGGRVRVVPMDLTRPGAPEALHEQLRDLDTEILINNAGIGMRGFFHELDAAGQKQMLQLNVNVLTDLTRLFLPAMVARKKGYVLNVSSTAAFQPGPLMAIYYASKAYVSSLSEALYNELQGTGVSVTALCPGPTATEFGRRAQIEDIALFKRVMDSGTVARIGFDAMLARKPVVVAGFVNRAMAFSTRFAPRQIAAGFARKLQEF